MSCQLTRHVTLSRDPSPAHHLQISNKSKNMDSSYEITQYVEGYLVPKIGKVVSYISFLVRDPGFILYCVSLRIWRRLYTVTLSHRIAPEIRTKTHKISIVLQKYIFRIIAVIFSKMPCQHKIFSSFERKNSEISCWLNVVYNDVQLPRMELVETLQRVSEPTTSSEFWQTTKVKRFSGSFIDIRQRCNCKYKHRFRLMLHSTLTHLLV